MAVLTIGANGSATALTTTATIAAGGHRDYLVVNESEHAITLTLIGTATTTTNNIPDNTLVSWRLENRSNHGTDVGEVDLGREYVIDAGSWLQLSAYNHHTAAQNVTINGIAKHITANSVGDTVFVTTYNTARTGAVN